LYRGVPVWNPLIDNDYRYDKGKTNNIHNLLRCHPENESRFDQFHDYGTLLKPFLTTKNKGASLFHSTRKAKGRI